MILASLSRNPDSVTGCERSGEMKGAGAKKISSPSRKESAAENYPPPLTLRFLRSNVRNKSRGRALSRSSPTFIARKKNVAATIETQEPSSPKVSCLGQVRVSHSMNFTPTKPDQLKQSQGTCSKLNLRKLASCFWFGDCKKVDVKENSSESDRRGHFNDGEIGNEGGEARIEAKEDDEEVIRGTASIPKNALLLTRCRSAPFRSSSNEIEAELKMTSRWCDFDRRERAGEKQMSRKLQIGGESEQIGAMGKQVGESSVEKSMEQEGVTHPLLLMRCKSASASRTGKEHA
ncbi:hypothetical protein ACET3Z_009447 [Daucus carota]